MIRLTYVNSIVSLYLPLMFLFSDLLLMLELVSYFPLILIIAIYQVVCVTANIRVSAGIKCSVKTLSILYTGGSQPLCTPSILSDELNWPFIDKPILFQMFA